ncbi:MAG: hypothetical protein JNL13_03670 [Chitinophagaceae bacterium]|nr:hypothetical protein [Chitinophagaceae bacterium]
MLVQFKTQAQESPVVDTSNYYSHYSMGEGLSGNTVNTAWLSTLEIVPVLVDELKKAGYEEVFDNQLYQTSTKQMLVLSAYCYNEDFGFVYAQGHEGIPQKEHRNRISRFLQESGSEYVQDYYQPKSNLNFTTIKKLPANILVLQEDCYWYQYTEDPADNKKLVTKDIILDILRQDIRAKIAKAPKAKQ